LGAGCTTGIISNDVQFLSLNWVTTPWNISLIWLKERGGINRFERNENEPPK
jgi:hypothetical protein